MLIKVLQFYAYRQQVHVKFSHCLVIWVKESVLKRNRAFYTTSEMSHPYCLTNIVGVC